MHSSNGKSRKAIVLGIDRNYTMPLTVCLRSILENRRREVFLDFYVLHSALGDGQKEPVVGSLAGFRDFELHWVPVNNQQIATLSPGLPHVSRATYFRFLAPTLLPSHVDVALYLDSDTIALGDVAEVFDLFDPTWAVQACRDFTATMGTPLVQIPRLESFGIDPDAHYFNSGVLLLNLRRWRAEKLAERLLNFAAENPDCLFIADQNTINIVLHGSIGTLPPEWNAQAVYPKLLDGTWKFPYLPQRPPERAKIYHFTSEIKPWNSGREAPGAALFQDFYSRTAWAERVPC